MKSIPAWIKQDFGPVFLFSSLIFGLTFLGVFGLLYLADSTHPGSQILDGLLGCGIAAFMCAIVFTITSLFGSEKKEKARMSIQTDIAIEDVGWNAFDLDTICDQAIISACAVLGYEENTELSLAFVDDAGIQELNRQFRHKDKPTNVLSFPMDGMMLGDIVLARETIAREAEAQGKKFDHHLTHLIIHGFLHLLGYDHMDNATAREMEAIEIATLAQMGIDNPYELKDPKRAIK